MKTKKAPGQDGLTVEVYKSFNNQLINLLTKLFNNVLKTGEYPTTWAQGLICPIYKSGSSDDPNNYRGITLLNCIGKIFTSILYKRISDWEEVRNLFLKNSLVLESIEGQQTVFSFLTH